MLSLPGPFGLGLAALGRPGYITIGRGEDIGDDRSEAAMRARAHRVLDAAYQRGVRYFDAARSYGEAEAFLASWLERTGHPDAVVGSKWGYAYTAGWQVEAERHEVKDHTLPSLERQYAETRSVIGDHLVLYQIHSATLESGVLEDRAVLARLASLRAGGTAVGITTSGPHQPAVIRRAIDLGCFDAVQATWNLLEQSAGDALAQASRAGMQVIVKEGLANGRLSPRGAHPTLLLTAAERGVAPDALALAGVRHRPWARVVLLGAATPDQVASNLTAESITWDDELEEWSRGLVEPPALYWSTRSALAWN